MNKFRKLFLKDSKVIFRGYILTSLVLSILAIGFFVYGLFKFDVEDLRGLSDKAQWISGTAGVILSFVGILIIFITFQAQLKQLKAFRKESFINSFESKYYKMTDYYRDTLKSVYVTVGQWENGGVKEKQIYGIKAFEEIYTSFKEMFYSNSLALKADEHYGNEETDPFNENKKQRVIRLIKRIYNLLDNKYQPLLGNYFRVLFFCIEYVDKQKGLREDEKKEYLKILRAQLSGFELLMLFYNCLSEKGEEHFKPLFIKYNFKKNIEEVQHLLLDQTNVDHKRLYD